jgi:hypothetical protein
VVGAQVRDLACAGERSCCWVAKHALKLEKSDRHSELGLGALAEVDVNRGWRTKLTLAAVYGRHTCWVCTAGMLWDCGTLPAVVSGWKLEPASHHSMPPPFFTFQSGTAVNAWHTCSVSTAGLLWLWAVVSG